MKTLPNGITVFNATPHLIRFWSEEWEKPIEVETDKVINAVIKENIVKDSTQLLHNAHIGIVYVKTRFEGNTAGHNTAVDAYENGVDVVVGSIIAAQAYPGLVLSMIPAPGYERVPSSEKRMLPDKFTVF